MTTSNETKSQKKKSIIRWEAIIPIILVIAGTSIYSTLFLDHHIRKSIEWIAYAALGSEVNVEKVKTSFFSASIEINKIQITNAETPSRNSLEIGSIRFSMLWDALLRAKVVVNEAALEGLRYDTLRAYPGKVKPPEPPSNKPGIAEKLGAEALTMVQDKNKDNVMGDIAALLGGGDSETQLLKLENSLASKEMLNKFEAALASKKEAWALRIKELPTSKQLEDIEKRIGKVKTQDFKTPQELQASLSEFDTIIKDGDAAYKKVSSATSDLNSDLNIMTKEMKSIEEQINLDIKELQAHFKIPSLDAASLGKSLFMAQLNPYISKLAHYRTLAYKYLPPKITKPKDEADSDEVDIQPHQRAKGITYEFGRPNSYPLIWIKRTSVSSEIGNGGGVKGEILNISSHQKLSGKPTTIKIEGDLPQNKLSGLLLNMSIDGRPAESIIRTQFQISSFPFESKTLIDSPDLTLKMEPKFGSLAISADLIGLSNLNLKIENKFNDVNFLVSAKNNVAQEILSNIFAEIKSANITATMIGKIPNINTEISSNVGPEVKKGLELQINKKIEAAKKQLNDLIEQEVGKKKKELDAEVSNLKKQFDSEITKISSQIEQQKKNIDAKINQAKKDSENKVKSSIEQDVKKAADELKKKLGF